MAIGEGEALASGNGSRRAAGGHLAPLRRPRWGTREARGRPRTAMPLRLDGGFRMWMGGRDTTARKLQSEFEAAMVVYTQAR